MPPGTALRVEAARTPIAPGGLRQILAQDGLPQLALGYAATTGWMAEATGLPNEVERFEPLGEPAHYRFSPLKRIARGRVEYCELTEGFLVHFGDVIAATPQAMVVTAPDVMRIRIASDCNGAYISPHQECLVLQGASAMIIVEPAGVPPARAVFAGHDRSMNVYLHRSKLQSLYAGREHELPAALHAFVDGRLERAIAQRLPLNAALLRCLDDAHACELDGHGRRLFIAAKAIEILCLAFSAMKQDEASDGQQLSAQLQRGVFKAQQQLNANYVDPPSLDELARQVGLSRSSLCAGFRDIIGQTVYDYVVELRMRQALILLNERSVPITQVAYAVGYRHPSSFSLAVQKRFGSTPSELRRRAVERA